MRSVHLVLVLLALSQCASSLFHHKHFDEEYRIRSHVQEEKSATPKYLYYTQQKVFFVM